MPDAAIQPSHEGYLTPSLEHATVADAMYPGILSCRADATITQVAKMMVTHHVHCIAVMDLAHDRSGAAFVWGIISDRDLLRAGIRVGADESAGALAQEPVISVRQTLPLREAGELMLANGVSHLVVVDAQGERPIGILSTLDVAGVLAWGAP